MTRPEGPSTERRAVDRSGRGVGSADEHAPRPSGPPAPPDLPAALSVAAHDVTEAVRVVTGYLELFDAHMGEALDEGAQRYLGGVRGGLDHLDRLVTGVLGYVRVSVEPPDIEDVELDFALEEALRPLRAGLEQRQARVVADDLPTLRADAGRTRDLLRALVANAVTFAGEQPLVVEITAERERDGWCLAVRDNGAGMPDDARERVFEPFERGHSRSLATGPGLGLAIARRIVERRGGRIWLDSGPAGTTVQFTVPDREPGA